MVLQDDKDEINWKDIWNNQDCGTIILFFVNVLVTSNELKFIGNWDGTF